MFQESEESEPNVAEKPNEEWQRRFGSAAKSTFEANGIQPRPASRLQNTMKETSDAISAMNNPNYSVKALSTMKGFKYP